MAVLRCQKVTVEAYRDGSSHIHNHSHSFQLIYSHADPSSSWGPKYCMFLSISVWNNNVLLCSTGAVSSGVAHVSGSPSPCLMRLYQAGIMYIHSDAFIPSNLQEPQQHARIPLTSPTHTLWCICTCMQDTSSRLQTEWHTYNQTDRHRATETVLWGPLNILLIQNTTSQIE